MKIYNRSLLICMMILVFLHAKSYSFTDIIPDPLNYQPMPFDVLNYDLKLDLRKYSTRDVTGLCKILVHRKSIYDGDYFIFHLQSLKVAGITVGGKEASYSAYLDENSKDFHYRVNYPDNTTDTVEFAISYSGIMTAEKGGSMSWGGAFYEEGVFYSISVGMKAPYISTARHWMPCFDLPQDKATFRGSFTCPANFKVASNGILKEVNDINGGAKEYVWEHKYPSATYLLNFAAGPYQLIDYKDYKVPIQIFSLTIDSAKSVFAYSELPKMNDCFESLFGDYPFEKIGYCNTTKGAMEHQTMISMPRSLIVNHNTFKNSNNITAAHELSHQWFGNMVTPYDFRNAWLNESFATYCESLWLNCRDGEVSYRKDQLEKVKNYIFTTAVQEGVLPLYDYSRITPSSNYPTTIYQKGAVVLGMLDYELGLKGFDFVDILKNYLNKFAYSNVTSQDFIDFVNNETKHNWDWFFEQWVYTAGWPKIAIEFDDIKDGKYSSKLKIKQIQSGNLYKNVPVEIMYYTNEGNFTSVTIINDDETKIDVGIDNNFKIDSIKVNPGNVIVGLFELKKIQVTTDIDDEVSNNIDIFQTGNSLIVNFESYDGYFKYVISDLLGNIIYSESKQSKPGANSLNIDLNQLSSSIYFLNCIIDSKMITKKISVIH